MSPVVLFDGLAKSVLGINDQNVRIFKIFCILRGPAKILFAQFRISRVYYLDTIFPH
jgi:hypothetical protein